MHTQGVPGSFLSLWKEPGSEAILVIVSIKPRELFTLEMMFLLTLLMYVHIFVFFNCSVLEEESPSSCSQPTLMASHQTPLPGSLAG